MTDTQRSGASLCHHLDLLQQKRILDPLLFGNSVARMICTSESCDYVSLVSWGIQCFEFRRSDCLLGRKRSASYETTCYLASLFHNFTSVSVRAEGLGLVLELPRLSWELESCRVNAEGNVPKSWRSSTPASTFIACCDTVTPKLVFKVQSSSLSNGHVLTSQPEDLWRSLLFLRL